MRIFAELTYESSHSNFSIQIGKVFSIGSDAKIISHPENADPLQKDSGSLMTMPSFRNKEKEAWRSFQKQFPNIRSILKINATFFSLMGRKTFLLFFPAKVTGFKKKTKEIRQK